MDGNGRWARAQGKERVEGHARGAKAVDVVTEECCRLGIGQLTLYCLSSENWKRPKPEIDFLMALLKQYLLAERKKILEQNIRFTVIGRREGLPAEVLAEIDENIRLTTANTGLTLCLAINYGSRAEIVDAVRSIATARARGELSPEQNRRGDDLGLALHGRHAGPGPAHPHGRRDAREQLPALANLVRGAVGDAEVLARIRRRTTPRCPPRLREPRAPLRRSQTPEGPA